MHTLTRTGLAGAAVALVLLLAGACSDGEGEDGAAPSTTTDASTTTTTAPPATETSAPPASETSAPASSETTAPPVTETTAPPEDGTEGEYGRSAAAQLIRAWGAGDRDRALQLATPEAVDELFGTFDPGGDDWDLATCDGAAGTIYCTFESASKAMTVTVGQPNVPDESGSVPLIAQIDFGA